MDKPKPAEQPPIGFGDYSGEPASERADDKEDEQRFTGHGRLQRDRAGWFGPA
jgi:hypothetical protein